MKNRKGIIEISHNFVNDIESHKENMFQLFSQFVPIRIETHFNHYVYFGYSPLFEEIPEATVAPTYQAIFTYNEENDSFDMEFKKVELWQK